MTPLPIQLLTIENQSSVVKTWNELFRMAWAVAYQLKFQYGRSDWVTRGLAPPASVRLLKVGVAPPPGAWNMVLLDDSTEAGTLGFHTDAEGSGIPFTEVFAKTALDDGMEVSAVLSHEATEMLVDPWVEHPREVKHAGQLVIVEVADPVEGNDYDVGAPEGRSVGLKVADFVLPDWFKAGSKGPYSFREAVDQPFELAPGGYISVAPESEPENLQPVFGEQRDSPPRWASRLPIVHGVPAADRQVLTL